MTESLDYLRRDYDWAMDHLRREQKEYDLAKARVAAASSTRDSARRKLIEATPTGAGLLAAIEVPWASLVAHPTTGDLANPARWSCMLSTSIHEAVKESVEAARISGVEISIPDVNGGTISASPGDTEGDVIKRYVDSGGVDLWSDR